MTYVENTKVASTKLLSKT